MDHMMPEMDGVEAARIIREEIGTAYARGIPIIALTANALIGNEKIFLERGFQAFISKPIDVAQLDAVVRRYLRNKDLEAAYLEGQDEDAPTTGADAANVPGISDVSAPEIDGIDMGKCLARFGGDPDVMLDVLRSYAENTAPLLDRLRETARDDLPAYAIIVHGVKGSSRGVCAESLGNMAEALEHAAKAGDADFVAGNNDVFIETAKELLAGLRAALDAVGAEKPKDRKSAPDAALLARIAECCARYDMDGIDEAMAELEAFTYETQADLVAWLRDRIDKMEFEEARVRLSAA
jgi:HPt (histidine-containing phosphotransfer) domain-containing protein